MSDSHTTSDFFDHSARFIHVQATLAPSPERRVVSLANTPDLTRALRAGDEDAFRLVHDAYNGRLMRYCLALAAGDLAVAGELVQSVYLRLYRHVRELPDEAALWNWMVCAARSAACDLGRTNGRYRRALERFTEWLCGRQSATRQTEDSGTDMQRALDLAVATLPEADRLLINARYLERVPLDEIGRRCGVSARAIEGRLARLRSRLRDLVATELRKDANR